MWTTENRCFLIKPKMGIWMWVEVEDDISLSQGSYLN